MTDTNAIRPKFLLRAPPFLEAQPLSVLFKQIPGQRARNPPTAVDWEKLDAAAGLVLTGMTGTGKSALLRRALAMVKPDQVIDWRASKACIWYSLRQAVYLKVDFASNESGSGPLKRILEKEAHEQSRSIP
ncbi:MAG: hypothetical protein EON58_00110 [Alphaproteobacteria bacterium]|nr:MAG: hypothetical protein EON58_00110 [Alphaproteobacteria bacterium]